MNKVALDTDILTAIIKRNPIALANAEKYLRFHPQLSISLVTRFEILRGLHAKGAHTQIEEFHIMCQSLEIFPISDAVVIRGADLYGMLRRKGETIGDSDILIGSTCLENGCEISTNNRAHFSRIPSLVIHNWLMGEGSSSK